MNPSLEALVRAHFTEAFGLPLEAADTLWQTGRQSLGEGLAALGRALEAGDIPAASHWAHSLKGNLLNMGLAELGELARSIEQAVQADAPAHQGPGAPGVTYVRLRAALDCCCAPGSFASRGGADQERREDGSGHGVGQAG